MVERLKRWESPRKRGRNDKGKGGSARARQIKKRNKLLSKKLKQNQEIEAKQKQNKSKKAKQKPESREGEIIPPLFFCLIVQDLPTYPQIIVHHRFKQSS